MMISKKDINGNPVHLNEGFISDKIASAKERKELAKSISRYKNDFKLLKIITSSGNKNIKDLMVTKGDFSKYPAYADIKYIISTIERVGNGVLPQDLSTVVNNIKKGLTIADTYEKEFKKAFSTDCELVKFIYLGLTSSIVMSTTIAYSKYLVTNGEDGKILSISNGNHNISSRKSCVALGDLVIKDASGELTKVIKDSLKSKVVNEADWVNPTVAGGKGSIGSTVGAMLDEMGKSGVVKGGTANSGFDKLLQFLFGVKKEVLADGSTKTSYSLVRTIFMTILIFIAVVAVVRFCISEMYEIRVKMADSLRDASENLRATAEVEGISASEREKKLKAAEKYAKLADKIDIETGVSESKADRELTRLDNMSDKDAKELEKSAEDVDFGI